MEKNIVNNQDFIAAVEYCVEKAINAAVDCGEYCYDEEYLTFVYTKRLLRAYNENCNTKEQLIAYAEVTFNLESYVSAIFPGA